jgi:hypothetical protein
LVGNRSSGPSLSLRAHPVQCFLGNFGQLLSLLLTTRTFGRLRRRRGFAVYRQRKFSFVRCQFFIA